MIERFIGWLKTEVYGANAVLFIIFFSLIALLVAEINVRILTYFLNIEHKEKIFPLTLSLVPWMFLWALKEEFVYRRPISLIVSRNGLGYVCLAWVIIAQIIFGLDHGSFYNIFIQGVAGCFYVVIFLKCGGASGKIIKPMLASASGHALYNLILVAIVFLNQ